MTTEISVPPHPELGQKMMSAPVINELVFLAPVIGPKVYMARGPSGWVETFLRPKLDAELATFAVPLEVDEIVDMFVATRDLAEKPVPIDWFSIIGFLGRTMNCSPLAVPHTVGIAFWAHVIMARRAATAN